MDHASDGRERPAADNAAAPAARAAGTARVSALMPRIAPRRALGATAESRPRLVVVNGAFRLAEPAEPAPPAWRAGLATLLDWLGIDAAFLPARGAERLGPVTGWPGRVRRRAEPGAPEFAPWAAWCPTAFQNGGTPALPQALFVASYCLGHARACAGPRPRGADVMLLSPHPAACTAEQAHLDALPPAGVLRAMIRAALAEGRERIAILVHARHRAAVERLRLAEDARLCPEGTDLSIRSIEEALPALMAGAPWDAIIAMPDLRGTVFAMLAETTGVRGAWPMLWCSRRGLERVTAEALGAPEGPLPLDAAVLVHALALALREAGRGGAALRLHESWARLRDRGVATPGRGSDAPYVTEVPEAEFLALVCRDAAAGPRAQAPWRALEKNQQRSVFGNLAPALRIVSANPASS